MDFVPMVDVIPEQNGSRFAVVHFEFTADVVSVEKEKYRKEGRFEEIEGLEAGRYVKLVDKETRHIVMSDTWMERSTNRVVLEKAGGHVLLGGLGIGLLAVPLVMDENTEKLTVVEEHEEVIALVVPHLESYINTNGGDPTKLEVVQADIYEYTPSEEERFDVIYFDIWNEVTEEHGAAVRILKERYSRRLNTEGWIAAWREADMTAT